MTETNESLETESVELEQNPNDPEVPGNIFRLVHTIKGTRGFLGLPRLESVAHAAENVLGNFRDGTQVVTPDAVTLILKALDRIEELMSALEDAEQEPEGEDSELIGRPDVMYRAAKSGPAPTSEPVASGAGPHTPPATAAASNGADPSNSSSLYERLGAASTIDAAVELVSRKAENDDALGPLFAGIQMARLIGRRVEYMVMALGGPDEFEPDDLRNIHQQRMANGATDDHFDAPLTSFGVALGEPEVAAPLIDDVLFLIRPIKIGLVDPADAASMHPADPGAAAPPSAGLDPVGGTPVHAGGRGQERRRSDGVGRGEGSVRRQSVDPSQRRPARGSDEHGP